MKKFIKRVMRNKKEQQRLSQIYAKEENKLVTKERK